MGKRANLSLNLSGADAILIVEALKSHARLLDRLVTHQQIDESRRDEMIVDAERARKVVQNFVLSCGIVSAEEMN